jgi:hypothetical protein
MGKPIGKYWKDENERSIVTRAMRDYFPEYGCDGVNDAIERQGLGRIPIKSLSGLAHRMKLKRIKTEAPGPSAKASEVLDRMDVDSICKVLQGLERAMGECLEDFRTYQGRYHRVLRKWEEETGCSLNPPPEQPEE